MTKCYIDAPREMRAQRGGQQGAGPNTKGMGRLSEVTGTPSRVQGDPRRWDPCAMWETYQGWDGDPACRDIVGETVCDRSQNDSGFNK